MSSSEVIKRLEADGWYQVGQVGQVGSHVHFKHPTKPGRVTVKHPLKDIPKGTLASIRRQAGLDIR